MSLSVKLHQAIDQYNLLKSPTRQFSAWTKEHKSLYKVILIANHLFRAVAMFGFMTILPFFNPVNHSICIVASLFYRLTVENHCAYKFAIPAYAGSTAYMIGKSAIINVVVSASLTTFASAFLALLPLCSYFAYVVLTVSYDVDHHCCR